MPQYITDASGIPSRVGAQILVERFTTKVGRPPLQAELSEMINAFAASKHITEATIAGVVGIVGSKASDTDNQIRQIYQGATGETPSKEIFGQLQDQFAPQGGSGTFRAENVRSYVEGNIAKQREAEQKTAYEKDKATYEAKQKDYETKITAKEDAAATKANQEARITQLGASIGGVSPSELEQLRAAITPPVGSIGVNAPPEQIVQDILAKRASQVGEQTKGFEALRSSLGTQMGQARTAQQTALETGLTQFGTQAGNVQKQVLDKLLPQIQASLAARGLETGGGAFQAQTATLATDLATQTEQQIAQQRLAGTQNLGLQESSDIRSMADLQAQHSEIQRIQAENDKLQREGRLDQASIDRLNQASEAFNRQYQLATGQLQNNQQYNQQTNLLNTQQGFQGLQNAFNRTQQQVAQDIQSRQFEQQLNFQRQQFEASQRRSTSSGVFPVLSGALSGAAQGGAAGGPWGAVGGGLAGGAKGYVDYRAGNELRNSMQSPYTQR